MVLLGVLTVFVIFVAGLIVGTKIESLAQKKPEILAAAAGDVASASAETRQRPSRTAAETGELVDEDGGSLESASKDVAEPGGDLVAPTPGALSPTAPSREAVSSRGLSSTGSPTGDAGGSLPPVGTVALVIDDLGRRLDVLDQLEDLSISISFSVLPFETRTAEVVETLRGRGREILLHLPMEAGGDADPGPGALFTNMTADELVRRTEAALRAVPGASGVNNHMGSRLSAVTAAMRPVLETLRDRELFFLDSRTSARSVGYALAVELGLECAQRNVFLDGERSPEVIRAQFRQLLNRARDQGAAVAIGHPYPETLAVLADEVPLAVAQGYRFVPVGQLVERRVAGDS